jgi:hypothetical protein
MNLLHLTFFTPPSISIYSTSIFSCLLHCHTAKMAKKIPPSLSSLVWPPSSGSNPHGQGTGEVDQGRVAARNTVAHVQAQELPAFIFAKFAVEVGGLKCKNSHHRYSIRPKCLLRLIFYINFDHLFIKKLKLWKKSNAYLNYFM